MDVLNRVPVREQEPQVRIKQADLTAEVIGHSGIVPDPQPQPYVQDHARTEFRSCDDERGQHHLGEQRHAPLAPLVDPPDQQKADASQHRHRPVGMSPPEHLHQIIERAAHRKEHPLPQGDMQVDHRSASFPFFPFYAGAARPNSFFG